MAFSRQYDARLLAVEALAGARAGKGDAASIEAAADSLERTAGQLEETDALGRVYAQFAALLRAVAYLVRWGTAVRTAELGAERYLAAAKQGARDFVRRTHASDADTQNADAAGGSAGGAGEQRTSATGLLIDAAAAIESVTNVDEVEGVAERLLAVPLPVSIIERPTRRSASLSPSVQTDPPELAPPPTAVAFLTFRLNGSIVPDPVVIQPDVLYDLALEVRLSRWPAGAARLEFSPLHVEPPGTVQAPVFTFDRPTSGTDGLRATTLHATGRLRVHCAQDFLARPLEIQYVASLYADDASTAHDRTIDHRHDRDQLVVQGQRQLSLQSFDPRLNPITGFREVDERLISVRAEARRLGVADVELADFLTLLGAVARVAGQALADDLYPDVWSEDDFQNDMRDRLRTSRDIGAELEEHPRAGGGITDLSFRKLRLELKADDLGGVTVDTALARYGQQTAQYVAASDRRCGLLAVLDTEAKAAAPGSVYNDVALRLVPPPAGSGRELLIGVVVVRGNLATPSDLSKRSARRANQPPRAAQLSASSGVPDADSGDASTRSGKN